MPPPWEDYYKKEEFYVSDQHELVAFFCRHGDVLDQIGGYMRRRSPGATNSASESKRSNPIGLARIGKGFTRNGKLISIGSSLADNLTEFVQLSDGGASMSGSSRFCHTEGMNQGSVGVSGTYGVGGVAQAKAAVSAYVGRSTAQTGRNLEVTYEVYQVAGVEQLDVRTLTAGQLIAGLTAGARRRLLAALEAYRDVLSEMEKDRKHAERLANAVNDWTLAVDEFTDAHGDGFVTAVYWGALGSVTMTLDTLSESAFWQYGGQSQFSYATMANAIDVKATYDGSQKSQYQNVNMSVTSHVMGKAIAADVKKWADTFNAKTFKEVADQQPIKEGPRKDKPLAAPSFPKTVDPKSSKTAKRRQEAGPGR